MIADLLASELSEHGCVRPPWVRFPDTHPFDIAWRMGAGETHVMLWSAWEQDIDAARCIAAIQRHGAVPADWAWWAAEAAGLVDTDDAEEIYDLPFAEVCRQLATVGIVVDGEPSSE